MTGVEQALWSACVALAREEGLASVTVADVCRRAGLHRSTFYKHFEGLDDLVERGTALLVREVTDRLVPPAPSVEEVLAGRTPSNFTELLRFARLRRDQLAVVCEEVNGFPFRRVLERALVEQSLERLAALPPRQRGPPGELVASYVSGALVGALRWWVSAGWRCPPDQVARWLGELVADGTYRALGVAPAPPARGRHPGS